MIPGLPGILIIIALVWIYWPPKTKKDEIVPDITDSIYDDDELHKN